VGRPEGRPLPLPPDVRLMPDPPDPPDPPDLPDL